LAGSECEHCVHRRRGLCASLIEQQSVQWLEARRRTREDPARTVLYEPGQPSQHARILKAGWAASFTLRPDGRRQMLSLLLPGDIFSVLMLHRPTLTFSFAALTDVAVCHIALNREDASAIQGFLGGACAEEVTGLQRRVVDLGSRKAQAKLAGFLLDLDARLRAQGATGDWQPLFMRQYDLADMFGMSAVHVSRVLSWLRHEQLIDLRPESFRVLHYPGLQAVADGI